MSTWTKLVAAYKQLQSAQTPYSINMVVNGDPRTRVGFNWFTNPTGEAGEVQVVEKEMGPRRPTSPPPAC